MQKLFLYALLVIGLVACANTSEPKKITLDCGGDTYAVTLMSEAEQKQTNRELETEVKLKDVYCHQDRITYYVEFNPINPKLSQSLRTPAGKRNFMAGFQHGFMKTACQQSHLLDHVKYQVFIKGEKSMYAEFIPSSDLCQ